MLHNGHEELYNFVTKKTHKCPAQCGPNDADAIGYAVGSRWLETFIQQPGSCGDGVHYGCGPITEYFYNIETGHFRYSSSTSSTTIADLNSRGLLHRVCPPLRVPPGGPLGGSYGGAPVPTLTFFGSFAVATATYRSWLLERCGSNLHMPIGMTYENGPASPPVVSTHAALWQVIDPLGLWHGQLAGVLLPSLRPFTAMLPSGLQGLPPVLSAFRLYVRGNGRVSAATIPHLLGLLPAPRLIEAQQSPVGGHSALSPSPTARHEPLGDRSLQNRPPPPAALSYGASEALHFDRRRGGVSLVSPQTSQTYVSAPTRPLVLHLCFPRRQWGFASRLSSRRRDTRSFRSRNMTLPSIRPDRSYARWLVAATEPVAAPLP